MIRAYAIDPAVVAGWGVMHEFRYFIDKFGLGTPRMLLTLRSKNKWRRQVLRVARDKQVGGVELNRLTALLQVLMDCHHLRQNSPQCDGARSWLDNAIEEYERCEFAGILTDVQNRSHKALLHPATLGDSNPRWNAPIAATPSRHPAALIATLTPMLNNCSQVRIVDPYFNADNQAHWRFLVALATHLHKRCSGPPSSVEVHCKAEESGTSAYFRNAVCKQYRTCPLAHPVEVIRWSQRSDGLGERLHNRYVMTEMGGVTLGGGLEKGDASHREDINLMSKAQHELRWEQFDARWRRSGIEGPFAFGDTHSIGSNLISTSP